MSGKSTTLSPRERVQVALRGGLGDRVPLTIYWLMFPRGDTERELRNAGVTIVERVPLFQVEHPRVEVLSREYQEGGVPHLRKELHTPRGSVYATYRRESGYGTSWWQLDYFVKKPEDYAVLEFYLEDRTYQPSFEGYTEAVRRYGEDGYVVGNSEYSPMNMLIYELLGMERFCLDLADRPEKVLGLYEVLKAKQRRMFEICADSPAELILYCGNISQEVVGPDRFRLYFLPCLNEFAVLLHQRGKLAGCHLDARMAILVQAVGESSLDVIEAFTPTPTCDLSVAEARQAWPGKVLWINFPSSVHLESNERIRAELQRILSEAIPGDRFLVGITEDIPETAWRRSLRILNEGLSRLGVLPLTAERFEPSSGIV
jgi:hypothetical protein